MSEKIEVKQPLSQFTDPAKDFVHDIIPDDQFITAKTPAGRWGDPEDMVGPCVFLASHASDFVNGQILYADGGILAYIGRQPK